MTNVTPEESIRRARKNARFTELADIYEYCYNHLEEWEAGEIRPKDLPHVGNKEQDVFSKFNAAIILRSIAFGCAWEEYVPANREDEGEASE